jgi:DNA-binding NarL/FixJ family response regulator
VLNNTNQDVMRLLHRLPNLALSKSNQDLILVALLNLILSNDIVRNNISSDSSCAAITSSKDGEIFYVGEDFIPTLSREFPIVNYQHYLPEKLFYLLTQSCKVYFAGSDITFERVVLDDYMIVKVKKITSAELLSSRLKQVAELFSSGLSHKEIGRMLEISPATVRNHIAAIYSILNLSGRSALKRKLEE